MQIDGTLTVANGYDVTFFGSSSTAQKVEWDSSANELTVASGTFEVNKNATGQLIYMHSKAAHSTVNYGPELHLMRGTVDTHAAVGDACFGQIQFLSTNDGSGAASNPYGQIRCRATASGAKENEEKGILELGVANGIPSGASIAPAAIKIEAQSDGTVDVSLGEGAGSLTTVVGDLQITGGNILGNAIRIGEDGAGLDCTFYAADSDFYIMWDASAGGGHGGLEFRDDTYLKFGNAENGDVAIKYDDSGGFVISQLTNTNLSIAADSNSQAAAINIGNTANGKSSNFTLGAKQLLVDGDYELTSDLTNVSQVVLQPSYSGDGSGGSSGSHELAIHSYFEIKTVADIGTNISISDGLLFNFDDDFTNHKCLYPGDKTGGAKDGSIAVFVDGSVHYIQLYAG